MIGEALSTEKLGRLNLSSQQGEALSAEVHDMAVELVEQVSEQAEIAPLPGAAPHVLLDILVDDLRCVIFRDDVADPTGEMTDAVHLSPREREIARMIAEGYPNKTIAAVLEISTWTVNTHLRRMFAKCGVRSRAALIAKLLGVKGGEI